MSKFKFPPNREYRIPSAPECGKKWYPTRSEALAAGRQIVGQQATGVRAYQCDVCRYPPDDVARPWHWARSLSTWAGLHSLRSPTR